MPIGVLSLNSLLVARFFSVGISINYLYSLFFFIFRREIPKNAIIYIYFHCEQFGVDWVARRDLFYKLNNFVPIAD